MPPSNLRAFAGALMLLLLRAAPAHACSSCGCSLNSDWATQGLVVGKGWRFDLRYDYFNQSELRSGTGGVDRASLSLPNDEEIQRATINRNYRIALDYSPSRDWGVNIALPYFDRFHSTVAEGDTTASTSHTRSIGDLRLVARYQGFSGENNTGVQAGIKLPTGSFGNDFISGPQDGALLDRGLQPGTGTTDLLLGLYHFAALTQNWDYFTDVLLQQPLNSRQSFKPGTGVNLNVGVRYVANDRFIPQFQINARIEGRESGTQADIENSGATLTYFSPGLTLNLTRRLAAFAFLQVPIYQRVNGLQIEPRYTASFGMHYIF